KAWSFPLRIVSERKSVAACCSKRRRSRILLLVSIRRPMRRARSVSRLKYWMVCGLPSSKRLKSSLVIMMTRRFFLSVTVNGTFTKLTGILIIVGLVGVCTVLGGVLGLVSCARNHPGKAQSTSRVERILLIIE